MSALQLPSKEEINAAYDEGREAVILLFQTTMLALAERIQKLEDQLAKNSRNSGKPPSSDGYDQGAPRPKSLRKRSRRKSGGQPGHPGETLKAVGKPDFIKVHRVQECQHCGQSLQRRKAMGHEIRQVFDLPKVQMKVTEHRAEIKAQMAYLNTEQHIPLERTCDLLDEFYQHRLSEGTIVTACAEAAQKVQKSNAAIKVHLVEHEKVGHFDETGMMVNGVLSWLHTASTPLLTYYAMHAKRGRIAINEIDILPRFKGRAVHDNLASYFQYELRHALCNANPLRTLLFLLERYPQKWVQELHDLLLTIKEKVEAVKKKMRTALSVRQANLFNKEYGKLVAKGLRANPPPNQKSRKLGQRGRLKQSLARNFLLRLRDHKAAMFDAFMSHTIFANETRHTMVLGNSEKEHVVR